MQWGRRSSPRTGVAGGRGGPAGSPAGAAEAPAGTRTVRPSTSTAMVAAALSGRSRNIEALSGKRRQHRVERARSDHRREQIGVRPSQGDAAGAVGGGAPGEFFGFVIGRETYGREHP